MNKKVICITKDRYFKCSSFVSLYRKGKNGFVKAQLYNEYLGFDVDRELHHIFIENVDGDTVQKDCYLTDEQLYSQFAFSQKREDVKIPEKEVEKEVVCKCFNRGLDIISDEYDIEFNMHCPNCNEVVGDFDWGKLFFRYCPSCGQKLQYTKENN